MTEYHDYAILIVELIMPKAPKEFEKLTKEEATLLAKSCIQGAKSEEEIRRRLSEAGFRGTAAVTSTRSGQMFMAMVMVWGPKGEIINA